MSLTTPDCVATAPELQDARHSRQLKEHLVELRTRHRLVSGFVDQLVPPAIRQALKAYCASVEELMGRLESQHEQGCSVESAVRTVRGPHRYERKHGEGE